jgi:hypothetical protein
MGIGDWIVLAVILAIIGLVVWITYRAKKSGAKCVGCPHAKTCGNGCTGCGGKCGTKS